MKSFCGVLAVLGFAAQAEAAAISYEGELMSYNYDVSSLLGTTAGTDEKTVSAEINYKYDLEAKTAWSREDKPGVWYIDAFALESEAYAELEFVFTLIAVEWRIIFPFKLIDVSPLEFYFLNSKKNDRYCFGAFYQYNFFRLVPYVAENW
eukprot:NODE_3249_length_796_cov_56.862115_g2712_i0.p1 GENE.NODE_3249_length_796_cov_56.862115_g2712_i0~~NODE_3249_length_796_cov_56.862115_g2712_i0.p1  ORF type:complete len:161 (+),score=54.68 NODE_3249_length_796_cov_56.862115_g2712_i0:34-483(+)